MHEKHSRRKGSFLCAFRILSRTYLAHSQSHRSRNALKRPIRIKVRPWVQLSFSWKWLINLFWPIIPANKPPYTSTVYGSVRTFSATFAVHLWTYTRWHIFVSLDLTIPRFMISLFLHGTILLIARLKCYIAFAESLYHYSHNRVAKLLKIFNLNSTWILYIYGSSSLNIKTTDRFWNIKFSRHPDE